MRQLTIDAEASMPPRGAGMTLYDHIRHLVPAPVRRMAGGLAAGRHAAAVEARLGELARERRPVMLGPWLGEVGFELLYWIPFLRWFTARYGVDRERLIAVSRGGAAALYGSMAARSYDALSFMTQDEFRRKNATRTARLGEQKQIAATPLDDEIVARVREREGRDVAVLHPAVMYRLFAPYWWGHRSMAWIHRYARFEPLRPPALEARLPFGYTAVKFYFNDCFRDTPANRAFVDRTIRALAVDGPVISLSTGVTVDDHAPCDGDVALLQEIRHLLTPESNLAVQAAIVAGARRFVGTYGGFSYLAPLCGVPAASYYSEPGSFSTRHLHLVQDVLASGKTAGTLSVRAAGEGIA